MTARAALVLVLAGCGDNLSGSTRDAAVACAATFSGNFAETATADSCAMLVGPTTTDDATLQLAVPTTTLPPSVMVTIDLGASPSLGTYSPETVASWVARGVQHVGNGVCVYNAGSSAVPTGSFELRLDALDAASGSAHGELALVLTVLGYPETDCGEVDTEQIDLRF